MNDLLDMGQRIPQKKNLFDPKNAFTYVQRQIAGRM